MPKSAVAKVVRTHKQTSNTNTNPCNHSPLLAINERDGACVVADTASCVAEPFSIHVDHNNQAHLSQHIILVLCDNGKKLLTHSIMLGSTSIDALETIAHVSPLCES